MVNKYNLSENTVKKLGQKQLIYSTMELNVLIKSVAFLRLSLSAVMTDLQTRLYLYSNTSTTPNS